ncbi:tripartite tricarboxylate transporter TctB family protein [Arthrobacter sp. zg-Y1219]|uniref:tripartite tricarboxylate transporter TctB family protein n=1 Tax=Arthrobacter sp. zg-Y1219 TaxID=3049067 RepID=UPI0024C3C346|nr:tripartite tricarboxylate transporter TctB family protein [Arthrobacter sp. zg-Y1219]MDK1361259.1 tripartite tricarboxylate transporter TctB family protein [Arthrobacter sp. zg-Y1219]
MKQDPETAEPSTGPASAEPVTDRPVGNGPVAESANSLLTDDALTPDELAARWEADAPPSAGGTANTVASLVALAIGVVGVVISLGLGLGAPAQPEPGMWPFIVSLVVVVLSAAQVVAGRRGGDGEKFSRYSLSTLFGFLTLLGLAFLMPVIGFEIPSLLLSLIWMKFLGGETWRSAITYSLLVVAAFYGIFVLGLGTSIPHLL